MMDSKVDLGLKTMIDEVFKEDRACEHTQHSDLRAVLYGAHGGKAEWYLQLQCGGCSGKTVVTHVCDAYVQRIKNNELPMTCKGCGTLHKVWIISVLEKG